MTARGTRGPHVGDAHLGADVQAGLAAVEEGLREAAESDFPFITKAAQHLVRAGERRLRPLVVLLAAQFGDPRAPGVVPSAVVIELTHISALHHDRVRDAENVRSDDDAKWSTSLAVMTGDFLFARASHLLAGLGPEAVRIQAAAFEGLVTRQILRRTGPRHRRAAAGSGTDSLIAVSGRFGAVMSGADESGVDALTRYGEWLGRAWRLVGDPAGGARRCADKARETLAALPVCPAKAALEELCGEVATGRW